MLNIILFGPPGSGKGTQSEKLIEKYQLFHISTGDILRSEIKANTTLGNKAKEYIDKGKLVPDEVVIDMLSSKIDKGIKNNVKGFTFDGFPRTIPQAKALDKMMVSKNISITKLLALVVSEKELTQRILKRGKTSGRTDDNDLSIIKQRIEEYENKTAPIAEYYKKQDKYTAIEGEGNVDEIFQSLCKAIDKELQLNS